MARFDVWRLARNRLSSVGGSSGGSTSGGSTSVLFATSFDVSDGWSADSTSLHATPGASGNSPTTSRHLTGSAPQDMVMTAANHSNGRGHRHYRGASVNTNGGGISCGWSGTNPEIWARYYILFQSGMVWKNGDNPSYTKDMVFGNNAVICGHQGGGWGWNFNGGTNHPSTYTWKTMMGSSIADGLWHCFEYHFNVNTGVAQMWVDNVLHHDISTASFSGFASFNGFFTGNQSSLVAAGYTDYDDIVITSTGRVGL